MSYPPPPTWTNRATPIVLPRRRTDLQVHPLDGEAVVFDGRTNQTHRLNPTALTIWQYCDGRHTTQEVAAQLTADFDVNFERALDHVEQLIVRLAEQGLFEVRGEK